MAGELRCVRRAVDQTYDLVVGRELDVVEHDERTCERQAVGVGG